MTAQRVASRPRPPIRTAYRALLLAVTLAAGCAPRYPGGGGKPANLVLITLDTTRADHLGCYGDTAAATPNLDRLATEGVLATGAVAVAPVTLPSHASLLTGQYPPRHGVRDNADFRLQDGTLTLAEQLKRQGYATAAAVGAYVLSSDFGIAQGFDAYDEPREQVAVGEGKSLRNQPILRRSASEVTDAALRLLGSDLKEPFFLWVHYFDPHREYEAPEPFAAKFRDRPYDGEIAYVDAQLGRLIDVLQSKGLFERTLLAVTGDHGESLGEHGEDTHGLFVYDSTLRVPLLLRFPTVIPAGMRTDRLVSGVDLAPTLLDLLGLPPLPEIDGLSFAPALRGDDLPDRGAVYSEAQIPLRAYGWSPLYSLRDRERKFIEAPEPEIYDLRDDPRELRNLAPSSPDELVTWRQRLQELRARVPALADATATMDPEARARLASLGYLSTGTVREDGVLQRPDPKRLVQLHNRLLAAEAAVARGALEDARKLLAPVLEADPTNPAALALDGTLLCTSDDMAEGLSLLEEAARRSPGVYEIERNLANALHLAGRLPEAAKSYRAALAVHPFSAEDRYALGNVLYGMGDVAAAVEAYEAAEALGLDSPQLHAALGVGLAAAGETERARASLQRAVDADPGFADAWNQLGILSEKSGGLEQARTLYARALAARPEHSGALFDYAKVCLRLGDKKEALAGVERLLAAAPDYPAGRYLEAQVRLANGDEPGARRALRQFLAQGNADPRLTGPAREMLRQMGE